MLCPTQIKLTVKKYDYLHVYKLTTYLVSLIINNDAYISVLPISPGGFRRAHISPEEDWDFLGKYC